MVDVPESPVLPGSQTGWTIFSSYTGPSPEHRDPNTNHLSQLSKAIVLVCLSVAGGGILDGEKGLILPLLRIRSWPAYQLTGGE